MKRLFAKKEKRDDNNVEAHEIDETPGEGQQPEVVAQPKRRLGFGRKDPSANASPAQSGDSYRGGSTSQYAEQQIGYLVGSGRDDWTRALLLADAVSSSDETAKDAAKALRQEFQFASPEAQIRAHRLLVILMRNSSDRFKLKIANKKFLDVVTKVYKAKTTPFEVKDSIVNAFAVLAYECKDDADLSSITTTYNSIKPAAYPINGRKLDPSDTTYDPTVRERSSRPPNSSNVDLWREAELAKSASNMLTEALSFTPLEEVDSNQLVQEFYTACTKSQALFVDALPWATTNAEQAAIKQAQIRSEAEALHPLGDQEHGADESTVEEQLLIVMTRAHEELNQAFKMYDDVQRRKRQQEEDKMVEERSRLETRGNRQDLYTEGLQAPTDGPTASGSRSASPQPLLDLSGLHAPGHSITGTTPPEATDVVSRKPKFEQAPLVAPVARVPQHSSFDDFEEEMNQAFPSQPPTKNPYFTSDVTQDTQQPEVNPLRLSSNNPFANLSLDTSQPPRKDSPEPYTPASPQTPDRNPFHRPEQLSVSSARSTKTSFSEDIQTPLEPSSKALGKMRRYSKREGGGEDDVEELERQQEARLRETYRLEAEAKAARRMQD